MDAVPSWVDVSRLIDAYADAARIGERTRAFRGMQRDEHGKRWSLDVLAQKVAEHTAKNKQLKHPLGRDALFKIEKGERQVSAIEAVVLAGVFGKSLAEMLLPEGALEEVDDWRLLEDAARNLAKVRSAARRYGLAMGKLRNRVSHNVKLKDHVDRTHRREVERDEAHHRAKYDRHVEVKSWLIGTPIEEDPMPPYEEWRDHNFLAPTPLHVTTEHALSDGELDPDLWYLGWSAEQVRRQFGWRVRGVDGLSPSD